MRPLVPATTLLQQRRAGSGPGARTMATRAAVADAGPGGGVPQFVLDRLADLALLHGVPFEYLVPRADLLPPESIRFFQLSAEWIAALHEGVLSVGERSTAEATVRRTRADAALPVAQVRERRRGRPAGVSAAESGPITGFLLRSAAVTGYPGLQVRGHGAADAPLALLRLDRPAQGVLLALFGGALAAVVIEEPHHGIRLGVDAGPVVQLRRADGRLVGPPQSPASVAVPMRAGGAGGVLDVAKLADRIAQSGVTGVPAAVSGGLLALQLLQPPVRQRFRRAAP